MQNNCRWTDNEQRIKHWTTEKQYILLPIVGIKRHIMCKHKPKSTGPNSVENCW